MLLRAPHPVWWGAAGSLEAVPLGLVCVCVNRGPTLGMAANAEASPLHVGTTPESDEFPVELLIKKENRASCFTFCQVTVELSY